MCLILGLVTLGIYWPTQHHDFVQYDDPEYVVENQTVKNGLTCYGAEWAFVDAHVYNYHPVTWLSHMLDCQLFGTDAGAHHLVNALFHSLNAALLFLALCQITAAFWRSAFVAAFFAWHPLRVESVAWISERKDVLSGLFFFLTLLAYAKYAESKVQGPESKGEPSGDHAQSTTRADQWSRYYWLSVILFALGLLAKPMLVTVPFILLLLDIWPLRRLDFAGVPSSIRHPPPAIWLSQAGQLIREKIPFILLSLGVGLITFLAQRSGGAVVSLRAESLGSRFATTMVSYLGYLEKTFWPHQLTVLYLRPASFPVLTITIAVVVVVSISVFGLYHFCNGLPIKNGNPAIAVGWFWFIVMLLPVCGLLQTGPQFMADRYTYLPSIGLGILIAWGSHDLILRLPRVSQGVFSAIATAALILSIDLTRHQLGVWQNTETLMSHALLADPNNYIAHQDLGVYYSKIGQFQAASEHRRRVRELNPAF